MKGDPCACGCGNFLTTDHPKAKYAFSACRRRAFEERIGYVPPRASAGVANIRARRPDRGVRVFFSSVEVAEAALTAVDTANVGQDAPECDLAALAIKRAVDRKRAT